MRGFLFLGLGLVLIGLGAYWLTMGYGGQLAGIAGAGWVSVILGALISIYGAVKIFRYIRQRKMAALQFIPTAIENRLLLHAMGSVSTADKKIVEDEMQTISNVYQELIGIPIQLKEIMEIVNALDLNFNIVEELSEHAKKVRPEMRETIVKACYQVMVSDKESAPSELFRIGEIGEALGIDPQKVESLLSEMEA